MKSNQPDNLMSRRRGFAMVMDRISGLGNMSRELIERFQISRRSETGDANVSSRAPEPDQAPRVGAGDSAEISPKAHRLIALRHAIESGKEALEGVPDVREDRIAEARSRLNRGFYNSVEVRNRIAERLGGLAGHLEDI